MWLVCVFREHIWQNKTHPWFVTAEEKRNGRGKKNGLPPPWALKAALVWIHRTTGAIGGAGGDCRSCGVCCIEGAQARSRILTAVPRHIVSLFFFFSFGCFFCGSEMDYSRHRSSLPFYLPREKKERIPRPEKPPLHYKNRLGLQVWERHREREREKRSWERAREGKHMDGWSVYVKPTKTKSTVQRRVASELGSVSLLFMCRISTWFPSIFFFFFFFFFLVLWKQTKQEKHKHFHSL